MSSGVLRFHEAMKLAQYPMPVHYGLVAKVLFGIYMIYTPLEYAHWSSDPFVGTSFTFILVFSVCFMQGVCSLLEQPFTYGAGVLDLQSVHQKLNSQLLSLLEQSREPAPSLSAQAVINVDTLRRTRSSMKVRSHCDEAEQKKILETLEEAQSGQTSTEMLLESGGESISYLTDQANPKFDILSHDQVHEGVRSSCKEQGQKDCFQTLEEARCKRTFNQPTCVMPVTDQPVQQNEISEASSNTLASSSDFQECVTGDPKVNDLRMVIPRFPKPPVQSRVGCNI